MWLTKEFIMEDFAAEVKKGKYKKINYLTWRELKGLPNEWDLSFTHNPYNYSEEDSRYVTISWDGCDWPYEFSINDDSFGEFLWNLLKDYDNEPIKFGLNTTTIASSLAKCAEAANKVTSGWSTSLNKTWEELQQLTVSNKTYATTKTPALEINNQGNLIIGGKTIEQLMDEATGASITTRKENYNMNLFKGFDFGSCENDNVKMSMYGVAVKNANGTWVSYDSKSNSVIDVDILNFNAKYLYKMPAAIKDIKVSDVIIHNRKPMFVTGVEEGKLLVIDPAAGEEKIILPTKSMFGFDFVTRVVNLFGDAFNDASADAPFGNMLPLMLLADGGKTDDMLPLMFLMGGGKMDMNNPLMMYFLMKDNKNSDILPLMFLANNNGFSFGKTCTCDCDKAN